MNKNFTAEGANYLSQSNGLQDYYINALQEQSFSPDDAARKLNHTTKSICVTPEDIIFDDVAVPD